jgi:hypothetical protein
MELVLPSLERVDWLSDAHQILAKLAANKEEVVAAVAVAVEVAPPMVEEAHMVAQVAALSKV